MLVELDVNELKQLEDVSGGVMAWALVVNDDGSGGWGIGFSAFGYSIGFGMGVGRGGLNFTMAY